ncbi:hypothetical protein [Amycolatopsis anabasis]|uniref:hypothetical protein n=1 Tax=Amycolatopsis anabasis TaxID=1840409 RepID=UPI00131D7F63|nr:hypothetical protein [Amycolatopsis anabasis]
MRNKIAAVAAVGFAMLGVQLISAGSAQAIVGGAEGEVANASFQAGLELDGITTDLLDKTTIEVPVVGLAEATVTVDTSK